jgi:cobalt-zinc-cadmium efflux system membrane fusion protein
MQEQLSSSSPASAHAMPARRQLAIVAVMAVVSIAALGLGNAGMHIFSESSGAAAEPTAPPPGTFRPTAAQLANLKSAPVVKMSFRTEQLTDGKIALNNDKTTPVFSPYSGRVTRVIANLGDNVKQGDRLLAIEATEFAQGQNDLVSAAGALNTATSQLHLTQNNEQRKHGLYDVKAGSLQDWQQSQADLITAKNSFRSAETALAMVRNRLRILGKTDAEIGALESAQRMDPIAYVLAPISGTVTDRQVGPGQYLQSGASTPVYSIGNLSTVWLVANVREVAAPLMRKGAPVEVRVLAYPGRVFKAKLTYVAPSIDPNSRRLTVRAEIENADGALKPEMFASFSISVGGESEAPAVPQRAIVYEGDGARVWVMQQGNSIGLRQIRTGRISNGMVEVLAGLTPGERVVTAGALFIDRAAKEGD